MPLQNNQTTNRQHAVPQNVLDVEFKIIADLTMRQFFYLMIFGAFAYISFVAIESSFKWLMILLFGGAGVLLALVPVQERGLDEWIINFFRAVYKPSQMVWRKEPVLPKAFSYQNIRMVTQEMITLAPTTSRRKLEDYLESYGATKKVDALDINVDKYVKQLEETYKPKQPVQTPPVTPGNAPVNSNNQAPNVNLNQPPAPMDNQEVSHTPNENGGIK